MPQLWCDKTSHIRRDQCNIGCQIGWIEIEKGGCQMSIFGQLIRDNEQGAFSNYLAFYKHFIFLLNIDKSYTS
jgi:hypothetical protein